MNSASGKPGSSSGSSRSQASDSDQARVRFSVDCKRRLVIAKFSERLTPADIQSYVKNLCAHPGFNASFSEIADISRVTELPLMAADFLELADRTDPFSVQSKRAFVVQSSLQKRAAWIHKILRNQRHFEIFQTLEEAERWITN